MPANDDLEQLWEDLLSEDAARIRRAWGDLTDAEGVAILAHLRRMRTEPGWQPPQQHAAAQALQVIEAQAQ